MNTNDTRTSTPAGPTRRGWIGGATGLAVALVLAACGGGGGGDAPAGSGRVTALTVGPVSGFGSIIVNGVRFDDSNVTVLDDDGNDVSDDKAARVQLGTMVEVESGGIDDASARATATTIRLGSEIKGPVQSLGSTADTVIVLGQTVQVRATTVFDASLGTTTVAGLVGLVVEVHVIYDAATASWIATRIEREDNPGAYKVRGVIANLDTAAKTFTIGAATIGYANVPADRMPATLADGDLVKVRLQVAPADTAVWTATRIGNGKRQLEDHDEAHLKGGITAISSATAFEVDGVPVDATNARIEGAPLALGDLVEVEGRSVNGTIVATKVEREGGDDGGTAGGISGTEFELHGTPENVDTTANTFVLRGLNVRYDETALQGLGEAQLATAGVRIEVKGTLAADRVTLTATRIKLDD